MPERRARIWEAVDDTIFDVLVVGGGINGAAAYSALRRRGYRVVLAEGADFASGTTQASAMWIWGGLIYLSTLDLATVVRLCRSRDRALAERPDWIRPAPNRYVATREDRRGPATMRLALWLYWALAGFRPRPPSSASAFPERGMLRDERILTSLRYEEAKVRPSDARFVLDAVLAASSPGSPALNYCRATGGGYDAATRCWRIEATDRVTGREGVVRARWIVNACGCWASELNRRFGIESAWKHVFGKGVFINLPRDPRHRTPLTFENRLGDAYSLIPWGPVALWGPTETIAADLERAFEPESADVRMLLDELNRHLLEPAAPEDIVALRCGVRPLAVRRDYDSDAYSLSISRRHVVERQRDRPWITLFGGKISSAEGLGEDVAAELEAVLAPSGVPAEGGARTAPVPADRFPGIDAPVISPRHSLEHEQCWCLEDYLRRRTNLAQWVPRHGLGRADEHEDTLGRIAKILPGVDGVAGRASLAAYRRRVADGFDAVIAGA